MKRHAFILVLLLLVISTCAPYAFAMTYLFPENVIRTGIACGVGSVIDKSLTEGMGWFAQKSLCLARIRPQLTELLYEQIVGRFMRYYPQQALSMLRKHVPESDRRVLAIDHVKDTVQTTFGEAFRKGGKGATQELLLLAKPWEYSLSEIQTPVYLWHGLADTTVPAYFTENHARLLANVQVKFYEEEGHFSLLVDYMPEIIGSLIK